MSLVVSLFINIPLDDVFAFLWHDFLLSVTGNCSIRNAVYFYSLTSSTLSACGQSSSVSLQRCSYSHNSSVAVASPHSLVLPILFIKHFKLGFFLPFPFIFQSGWGTLMTSLPCSLIILPLPEFHEETELPLFLYPLQSGMRGQQQTPFGHLDLSLYWPLLHLNVQNPIYRDTKLYIHLFPYHPLHALIEVITSLFLLCIYDPLQQSFSKLGYPQPQHSS